MNPIDQPWPLWVVVSIAAAAAIASALAARRRGRPPSVAVLFAVLFVAGVALQLRLGARLQSDGFYYYAYLRSMAFDRDVDFTNDYRLLGLGDKPHLFVPTVTGHAQTAWAIGQAIVWAPFFAVGHGVARVLHASHPNVSTDGISYPYRQAICLANLLYGLLGCWFCYRFAARWFPRRISAAATTFTVAGSFILWYLVKEPSMAHAPSMAAVAGFAWAWSSTRERRTIAGWAGLGGLAGLMTLIRWQNIVFALLPAIDLLPALVRALRAPDVRGVRLRLIEGAVFAASATIVFLPQMIAWHAIYGHWLTVSPIGPELRWAHPHIVDILWSARNGLLSTSPILYVGAAGLAALAVARPGIGVPALAPVALMTYVNASVQDWWGSAGFGGRRFDGTIPMFVLGVAFAVTHGIELVRRHAAVVVCALGALLVLGNLALIGAAEAGEIRLGETTDFGRAWSAQARVLHGWFGNPFTYPVSLAFALRNGVSPGDYDLLSGGRFLDEPLRPYGRIDVATDDEVTVREGWYAPEHEGELSFRWAGATALVRLPLDHAADLRVQLRLHAFAFPGAPPQRLSIYLNGASACELPVPSSWSTIECRVARDGWRAGVNRVELRFAWARRPSDVRLGSDPRPLAAAVDYIRVAVAQSAP